MSIAINNKMQKKTKEKPNELNKPKPNKTRKQKIIKINYFPRKIFDI